MAVQLFNLAPGLTVSRLCLGFLFNLFFLEFFCSFVTLFLCFSFSSQEQWLSASRIHCPNLFYFLIKLLILELTSLILLKCMFILNFYLLNSVYLQRFLKFQTENRYPVPQRAETQGRSEEYFGRWIRDRNIPRDRVVFATKVLILPFLLLNFLFLSQIATYLGRWESHFGVPCKCWDFSPIEELISIFIESCSKSLNGNVQKEESLLF